MKIAILCKNAKKLTSSIAFLRKRDIQATAFTTLPSFLQGMKDDTYDIMLISLNMSHQKPEKIPALMQQMFKMHAIVFCEVSDAATQLALNSFRFKIPAQATGPAIAMTISRVFRELEMKANGKLDGNSNQRNPNQHDDDDQQIITMSGAKLEADTSIYRDSSQLKRVDSTYKSTTSIKKTDHAGHFAEHDDISEEEIAAAEAEMAREDHQPPTSPAARRPKSSGLRASPDEDESAEL